MVLYVCPHITDTILLQPVSYVSVGGMKLAAQRETQVKEGWSHKQRIVLTKYLKTTPYSNKKYNLSIGDATIKLEVNLIFPLLE